jgi:hypothetical protein
MQYMQIKKKGNRNYKTIPLNEVIEECAKVYSVLKLTKTKIVFI